VLESEDELFDFRVALIENIQRKNLSDPELAAAIKEYDEMMRRLKGSKPKGNIETLKQFTDLPQCSKSEGWTQEKTAKELNISQQAVAKAIQIATAIEEYPELAKEKKGEVILREYRIKKEKEAIQKEKLAERADLEIRRGERTDLTLSPSFIKGKFSLLSCYSH